MSRDDETGAVAAATYFLTELYAYTLTSQDTGPWLAMSHNDCIYCSDVANSVREAASAASFTEPGAAIVTDASSELLSPLAFGVTITAVVEADRYWSADGRLLDSGTAMNGTFRVVILRDDGGWVIRGVEATADSEAP